MSLHDALTLWWAKALVELSITGMVIAAGALIYAAVALRSWLRAVRRRR